MSDQNQMAISPVVAGATGAVLGGAGGYFIKAVQPVKSEFKEAKTLLTMEQDTFSKIDAEGLEGEVKNNYDTFVSGRKEIADAEAAHNETVVKPAKETYAKELEAHFTAHPDPDFGADKQFNGKTIADHEAAVTTAEGKIKPEDIAANEKVKTAQTAYDTALNGKIAELEAAERANATSPLAVAEKAVADAKTAGTYDANKTALDQAVTDAKAAIKTTAEADAAVVAKNKELKAAREAFIGENPEVKAAKEALAKAKEERLTAMEAKLKSAADAEAGTDGPLKAAMKKVSDAKKSMLEKFDAGKKADELLKDTKYSTAMDKIKGILPRAKMWPTIIGAAALGLAGVALAYIVGPKNDTPSDVA